MYALRSYVEIREAIRDNFIASVFPFSASFLIKAEGRRGWGGNSGHRAGLKTALNILIESFIHHHLFCGTLRYNIKQELNLIFKQISQLEVYKMYRGQRGEFACWAWRLKMANRRFCEMPFWYTFCKRKCNQIDSSLRRLNTNVVVLVVLFPQDGLSDWMTDWLTDCLSVCVCLTDWLTHWLTNWQTDCLTDGRTDR